MGVVGRSGLKDEAIPHPPFVNLQKRYDDGRGLCAPGGGKIGVVNLGKLGEVRVSRLLPRGLFPPETDRPHALWRWWDARDFLVDVERPVLIWGKGFFETLGKGVAAGGGV